MKHIRNKTFGLFLNLFREERVVGLAEDDAPETAPALDESSPEDDEARLDAAVEATTAAGKTARTTTRSKVERDVLYKRIEEKKNKAKEFSHKIAKAVREGKISPKTSIF